MPKSVPKRLPGGLRLTAEVEADGGTQDHHSGRCAIRSWISAAN